VSSRGEERAIENRIWGGRRAGVSAERSPPRGGEEGTATGGKGGKGQLPLFVVAGPVSGKLGGGKLLLSRRGCSTKEG